ncbi:MAG: hypothetical protein R3E87_21760 [Burkholderiaceae bacterium]
MKQAPLVSVLVQTDNSMTPCFFSIVCSGALSNHAAVTLPPLRLPIRKASLLRAAVEVRCQDVRPAGLDEIGALGI